MPCVMYMCTVSLAHMQTCSNMHGGKIIIQGILLNVQFGPKWDRVLLYHDIMFTALPAGISVGVTVSIVTVTSLVTACDICLVKVIDLHNYIVLIFRAVCRCQLYSAWVSVILSVLLHVYACIHSWV